MYGSRSITMISSYPDDLSNQNYTFTISGNSSADTDEIKVGDIVIDDNGDKVRVKDIQPNRSLANWDP